MNWTDMRKTFRSTVRDQLEENGPMTTQKLYSRMEDMHPGLCDDSISCTHGNSKQPEWKHQMRWAQQDLKHDGQIEYDGNRWRLA